MNRLQQKNGPPCPLCSPLLPYPYLNSNCRQAWRTSVFPAWRNWRHPSACHMQLCSWSTLIFCPTSKCKTLWLEFWSIIPISIYSALFTRCWDLLELFLSSQHCTAKTQSWNQKFLEPLLVGSSHLLQCYLRDDNSENGPDYLITCPCLQPSTTNIRRLREKQVVSLSKMQVQGSWGRTAASYLQSQGKVALRVSLGSLEVFSRKKDWNFTPCMVCRFGGLSLCLLEQGKGNQAKVQIGLMGCGGRHHCLPPLQRLTGTLPQRASPWWGDIWKLEAVSCGVWWLSLVGLGEGEDAESNLPHPGVREGRQGITTGVESLQMLLKSLTSWL